MGRCVQAEGEELMLLAPLSVYTMTFVCGKENRLSLVMFGAHAPSIANESRSYAMEQEETFCLRQSGRPIQQYFVFVSRKRQIRNTIKR